MPWAHTIPKETGNLKKQFHTILKNIGTKSK